LPSWRSSGSGRKAGYFLKDSGSLWKGREFSVWGKEKVTHEPSSNCFSHFKTLGDGSIFFLQNPVCFKVFSIAPH